MSRAPPAIDRLASINPDGSRAGIEPADVHGRFVRARTIVALVLIALYVALPLVRVGGQPAVQLDIAARHFHLFGEEFNAQDVPRLVFLLLTAGSMLLFVTALLGRVWCGWACPQTVFLEGVYRRLERWIDGPREARVRRRAAAWTAGKLARRIAEQGSYLAVSLALAHVFLAYFVSVPALWRMVREDPRENLTAFLWVMAIAFAVYFDFAWFREQLCIVVCPYGRLQSALQDRDSVIIGYDEKRGEPRGHLTRAEREGHQLPVAPKGDCVDCLRCVAVCPTGIDIRQGSQLECVGCARCIDACDEVMARLGRKRGLIRYDSQAGLDGEKRRLVRLRVALYGALVLASLVGLVLVTVLRQPFEANLLRVQGVPYLLDGDVIRNEYELHVVNKNPVASTLAVTVEARSDLAITLPERSIRLQPLEDFRLPIVATLPRAAWRGPFSFEVEVDDGASGKRREVRALFLGPP